MGKGIKDCYVNFVHFFISYLLIIPVIFPLLPLVRAGEANTIRTHSLVKLKLLLTRYCAAREMLACKTEQGCEEFRM